MHAAVYKEAGGPEVITIEEVEAPSIQDNQVLVQVRASGLNRAEILQRKGFYPAPSGTPENILGLEFAGIVSEVGKKVKTIRLGQRVFGITGGGCQAEYVAVHESLIIPIPERLDFIFAAAVPEAYITASDAIYTQLNIKPGEDVLVHAIGSSVGIALFQLLKEIRRRVFGTSRTQGKLDKAKGLGLDVGINTTTQDFVDVVKSETKGKGVAACVDFVGAPMLDKNLDILVEGGKLLILGLMGGTETTINLNKLLSKRLKIVTTSMRTLPLEEKAAAINVFKKKALPLLASGLIDPVVDRVFKLEELSEAHRYMESNQNFGKIVISIS